jgi:hypothetical protein
MCYDSTGGDPSAAVAMTANTTQGTFEKPISSRWRLI